MNDIYFSIIVNNCSNKSLSIDKNITRFEVPHDSNKLIFRLWNIDPNSSLSIADLTALADNLPRDRYWLRTDPMSLQIDLVHIYLLGNMHLQLQAEEIQTYQDLLNSYLQDLQIRLITPHPRRWYFALDKAPQIHTQDPQTILGRAIFDYLLTGNERADWLRLFNELQMVLYTSEINKHRAQQGLPSVDALWFWGEGIPAQEFWEKEVSSKNLSTKFIKIFSNMPMATGLAKINEIPCAELSIDFNQIVQQCEQPGHYLICADFSEFTGNHNFTTHYNTEALLQEWLNTMQTLLKKQQLSCIDFYPGDGYGYRYCAKHRWWTNLIQGKGFVKK
jgi:hypothetical protein